MCIFLFQGAPGEPKVSRTVDMFSEDMFAENYSSPSSTAKMIANQVRYPSAVSITNASKPIFIHPEIVFSFFSCTSHVFQIHVLEDPHYFAICNVFSTRFGIRNCVLFSLLKFFFIATTYVWLTREVTRRCVGLVVSVAASRLPVPGSNLGPDLPTVWSKGRQIIL